MDNGFQEFQEIPITIIFQILCCITPVEVIKLSLVQLHQVLGS